MQSLLSSKLYALCLWKMLFLTAVLPAMVIWKHWENVAKKQNLCLDLEKTMKKKPKSETHAVFVSISDNL